MKEVNQDSKDLSNAVYEGMCDLRVTSPYKQEEEPKGTHDFTYALMDKLTHSSYTRISPVDEKYLWLKTF